MDTTVKFPPIELKTQDLEAWDALVLYWSEFSMIGKAAARRDLEKNPYGNYLVWEGSHGARFFWNRESGEFAAYYSDARWGFVSFKADLNQE